MESGYDIKFEEMKKYIPFLESMIRRLENTAAGSMNPRQAQLSKIRSLRDLLLDKNKRMKMENLLKCEQVLVNLYSKVEQRDTLPGINKAPQNMSPPPPAKDNLDKARRKLIEAVKTQAIEDPLDTLPEIARANQTEVVCSGSKEPALFQRRPNKPAAPLPRSPTIERSYTSTSKRNYTRILVSPEPASERRLKSPENSLYQRRSPRKPHESVYHKKERKRDRKRSGSKGSHSNSDFNITLKVPQESLGSLNTEDIFDRIIHCDNADVDISTLRDLRSQILGELKQTGVKEDISDLILKSYNKKKKKKSSKRKPEVEEGELSDSESEAIENIYGSLVVLDGDKGTANDETPAATEKDADTESRKIQIRLVISNSDKDQDNEIESENRLDEIKGDKKAGAIEKVGTVEPNVHLEEVVPQPQNSSLSLPCQNKVFSQEIKKIPTPLPISSLKNIEEKIKDSMHLLESRILPEGQRSESAKKVEMTQSPRKENKANFYNPIFESEVDKPETSLASKSEQKDLSAPKKVSEIPLDPEEYLKLTCDSSDEFKDEDLQEPPKETPKIPFLSEPSLEPKPPKASENVVSQIDILQALKNEILSESLSLPGTEVETPALHQPKVTKVSNVKEISVKKTISIEKYKQKAQISKSSNKLFTSKAKEDLSQKPSRGLTAKEYERFNFSKLVLDDLSDEDDGKLTSADVEDIYADLAPQSPDSDIITSDLGNDSPVIIPADPVKPPVIASAKSDVDMRAIPPIQSPQNVFSPNPSIVPVGPHHEQNNRLNDNLYRPSDPRKRKDIFNPSVAKDHCNSPLFNPGGTPRQSFPNMTPSMTPNTRSLEMTPSHSNFEEDLSSRKHVYAPSLWDNEREQSDARSGYNNMGDSRSPRWEEQNTRNNSVIRDEIPDHRSNRDRYQHRPRGDPRLGDRRDDAYSRADCSPTPSHYFGRGDYPSTPSHPFGRSECPSTPSHPFGRSDVAPTTPIHPFGSGDCPPTPSHPFGMSDVPNAQSHPFGRAEYPVTPSHPFSRSECPTTPIHPFGRSGGHPQDPRCNRNHDESDHGQSRDKNLSNYNSYDKYGRQYPGGNDPYNRFGREHDSRNDNRSFVGDRGGGHFNSDGRSRAPSVGRTSRDFECDRPFNKDYKARRHGGHDYNYDSRVSVSDVGTRRLREGSVGRVREQHNRSNSRAPSVGRTFCPESTKTVSVESHAGRSFTIDTSVKSTFQEFNFNELDLKNSFDARRQRAASVGRSVNRETNVSRNFNREGSAGRSVMREGSIGRSLYREGSVGRSLANEEKVHTNRNYAFKRAQSVGRDLSSHAKYSDHQARFESFKAMATAQLNKAREKSVDRNVRETKTVPLKETSKPINSRDPRYKNDFHVSHNDHQQFMKNKKDSYPTAMKYRDPRLRKNTKMNRYNDQGNVNRRFDSYERKKDGIVYTNDNIAKGNILGPGYGVKNYKIPKIKRPVEEVLEPPPKVDEKKDKTVDKPKESDKKDISKPSDSKIRKESKTRKEIEKLELKPQSKESKAKNESEKRETKSITDSTLQTKETKPRKEPENNQLKSETESKENRTQKQPDKSEPKSLIDSTPQPQRKNRRRQRRIESPRKDAEDTSPIRTRRSKRSVIYDSESDNNTSDVSYVETKEKKASVPKTSSPAKGSELDDDLQFSFDIPDEDLDIFSENIASDTVIDNINDLIADLDKDIGSTKGDDSLIMEIAKDNTFDNILESLKSADSTNLLAESNQQDSSSCNADNLDTLVPSIRESADALQTEQKRVTQSTEILTKDVSRALDENEVQGKRTEVLDKPISLPTTPVNVVEEKESHDVVSTSISEEQMSEKMQTLAEQDEKHGEASSTPDSTINTDENSEQDKNTSERLPDSTNDTQLEMNSDISSTHDQTEKNKKAVAASSSSKLGSLDSILSLLKDKTKIKELLSMLDDQTDNEKMKKKLEKLSEIVSDEDEPTENKTVTDTGDEDKTALEIEDKDKTVVEIEDKDKTVTEIKDQDKTVTEIEEKEHYVVEMVKKLQDDKDIAVPNKETKKDPQPEEKVSTVESKDAEGSKEIKTATPEKPIESQPDETTVSEKSEDSKEEDAHEINESSKDEDVPAEDESDNEPILLRTKRGKKQSKGKPKKPNEKVKKRITRSSMGAQKPAPLPKVKNVKPQTVKKKSTELQKLQNDLRDMFISNEVLNATGIRMCRLAKLVDQKEKVPPEDSSPTKTNDSSAKSDAEGRSVTPSPVVVLEKINKSMEQGAKSTRKKTGPKSKTLNLSKETEKVEPPKPVPKVRAGPKSKTKPQEKKDMDPYDFESDSISETTKASENYSSDSDDDSLASSQSLDSSDLLVEMKSKPKRKRYSWNKGVIKRKTKNKDAKTKEVSHQTERPSSSASESHPETAPALPVDIPDWNCFIDKSYCFSKNNKAYKCRLCGYECENIVHHYKKKHPHYEIPLSRMNSLTAKEAIKQSMITNFQQISKVPVAKYVCRFCFLAFDDRRKNILEAFFWHVVSTHTGEYKQLCPECTTVKKCNFMLDIPPPPQDKKGLLMGYICGKCNYTQVSLENLKNHVSVRHNDEETEVYTISLGAMTQKMVDSLKSLVVKDGPRAMRSLRSKPAVNYDDSKDQSFVEPEEPQLPPQRPKSVQSRISFEGEAEIRVPVSVETPVKSENEDEKEGVDDSTHMEDHFSDQNYEPDVPLAEPAAVPEVVPETTVEPRNKKTPEETISDVFLEPHFKVCYTESGQKEYLCCINGMNHYKTALIISMKKHIQMRHSKQPWDGYCSMCNVIIMPQGVHAFMQLLVHLLDTHMGNFPELEKPPEAASGLTPVPAPIPTELPARTLTPVAEQATEVASEIREEPPRGYISVRPLTQLLSRVPPEDETPDEDNPIPLPKIQSVISLNAEVAPAPPTGLATEIDNYQEQAAAPKEVVKYKYEEVQKEIMDNKHQIVLDAMLSQQSLAHVFKCAGRYCSFTCNDAESALVHESTHSKIGGTDALRCCYCSFDASGNAIDLVSHVFKEHGSCKFSCKQCFYRAFTSPLVEAHYIRAHGTLVPGAVLQASVPASGSGAEVEGLLTRQEAVRYYSCCFGQGDEGCRFKTYTPGKFCEHLLQKHTDATTYPCDECAFAGTSPTLLVQHLQAHGLKLYQCTWCVHGTDTETEMLDHASLCHPTKRPQAYLRHKVETKAGVAGPRFKVLPFVHITKKNIIPPVEVPNTAKADNPAREAARALELEKLIGHTSKIIEESTAVQVTEYQEEEDVRKLQSVLETSPPIVFPEIPADAMVLPFDTVEQLSAAPLESHSQEPMVITIIAPPRQVTPSPVEEQMPIAEQSTPNLKMEPPDENMDYKPKRNHATEVIYCLDSDEDPVADDDPPVIDLSDENENDSNSLPAKTTTGSESSFVEEKRLPWALLYKCDKCQTVFKTGYLLKRNYSTCYPNVNDVLHCAHCPYTSRDKNDIVNHYGKQHGPLDKHLCGVCNNFESNSKDIIKQHTQTAHGINKISHHLEKRGEFKVYVALPATESDPKPRGRRKRSSGEPTSSTPAKLKRYGPNNIDALPINQIFDEPVQCSLCDFSNKVRQNMIRHFQLHSQQQHVPQNAPVNPVPHLESNEMHFDKMLNLASSSIVTRTGDKAKPDSETTIALYVSPEAATRYPVYVPERKRYACGAQGCSYISIDEAMLKCHWETLHSGSNDYHCVHCPPIQQLDTSRPLTAGRIIAHLKMHDIKLFGCSACMFYHHQQHLLEKHVTEKHNGNARVKPIRGPASLVPPAPPQPSTSAPTMDLKPWQCGLCKFKSMLRPEVVEHCSKQHQSKFQFKCGFCPWRSSAIENVTKHHSNSHSGQEGDVFYFYYREGSIPDVDGMPRWMKQRLKINPEDPEIKAEKDPPPPTKEAAATAVAAQPEVDLNLVKKEAEEPPSIEALCKKFGDFCEPNGLKFKCSLCKQATEDTKEAMQSHLYEELKYRKWGCSICSYKAFHQKGLKEHAHHEHRQNLEPVELPSDSKVETWVTNLLAHQEAIMKASLVNLQKQKPITPEKDQSEPSTSLAKDDKDNAPTSASDTGLNREELEQALGKFGEAKDGMFACPKCDFKVKDESQMTMHLESELNKLRWRCSACQEYFDKYHEAQLHCKSVHPGQAARAIPATRDPVKRNAWLNGVIRTQKEALKISPIVAGATLIISPEKEPPNQEPENSLLVFRYEETVPTPEEDLAKRSELNLAKRKQEEVKRKEDAPAKRKRPVYNLDDSDEERLVIVEPQSTNPALGDTCPYCEFKTHIKESMRGHVLRHYDIRPYKCPQCDFNGHNQSVARHQYLNHPGKALPPVKVQIPQGEPTIIDLDMSVGRRKNCIYYKCLLCDQQVQEHNLHVHVHPNREPQFAQAGEDVIQCRNCTALRKTLSGYREHHKANHPNMAMNYSVVKLDAPVKIVCKGTKCNRHFGSLFALNAHHKAKHGSDPLKYENLSPFTNTPEKPIELSDDETLTVNKNPKRTFRAAFKTAPKRIAKKSTTKLPSSHPVARKSTTKLPFLTYDERPSDTSESELDEEYSYYGTKPPSLKNYSNVTTLMPVLNMNTVMPFTLKQLSEYLNINPKVVVKDVAKK